MDNLKDVTEFMKVSAEKVGTKLIAQMRQLASSIDRTSGVGNLGNNAAVNALAYALDAMIADMSVYKTSRDRDEVFNKITDEHQHLLQEIIARYSTSGKSLLVNVREEENHGNG